MKLFIVESPGKKKKLSEILGPDFRVEASVGHVRDLPVKEIGVAPPYFKPDYVPTERGKSVLAKLGALAKQADTVYLATDPDREGEAIAWHLEDALKLKNPKRVTYSEITEKAVKEALNNARSTDLNLVRAQEGRRVLDRLVGYKVSPALSNVAGSGFSAGRVQSPALRLVVEREAAIKSFTVTQHFSAELTFESETNISQGWAAQWNCQNWLADGQEYFLDKAVAEKIATVKSVTVRKHLESETKKSPPPPFTTSSLQQAASATLKFSPKQTMELAQKLYEGGHITYMRTDSPNLSEEAITEIRSLAAQNDWPVPPKARTWSSKAGAQEAHEAIRPTHFDVGSAGGNADEQNLYNLIRLRALASQLDEATYAVTRAILETELDGKEVIFEAKGRRLISPGWQVVLADSDNEEGNIDDDSTVKNNPVPQLREGGNMTAKTGRVLAKKTQAPARFSEASLIKQLENLGIGRPSTYAAILDNIINTRKYVAIEKRQLRPTEAGEMVIANLAGKFSFLDFDFTKKLEAQLDEIAEGKADYLSVIKAANDGLESELKAFSVATGHACPECGWALRHLVKKDTAGKKGYDFWSCSGYPECKVSFPNHQGKPKIESKRN